ncbi:MAG: hypothetical protein ACI8TX_002955 [Hyphomicrobiaceae bacterium]|jgi:hypothetical protein
MSDPIPTAIEKNVAPSDLEPRAVGRMFRKLLADGVQLRPAGLAKGDPAALLSRAYQPRYCLEVFGTTIFLADLCQNPELRYYPAYVWNGGRTIWPRIFYKDLSLIWRAASHFVDRDGEFWIGKGDVTVRRVGDDELIESVESTTDLPLEIQDALEGLMSRATKICRDERVLGLVLRNAPASRIEPYSDFTRSRRLAAADPRNLINGGRRVARFRKAGDPESLTFVRGYEPDFSRGGVIDRSSSTSGMYGGLIERVRVLSANRRIQYLFMSAPNHTWLIPPQALTTELSPFAVRTIDVVADDDLFVPGYEYHYVDDSVDPPELYSQIPSGYAGEPSHYSADRASTAAWLDALPVVREFRRKVLGRRR